MTLQYSDNMRSVTDNATRVMLEIHTRGKGVCGIFTHEIAESKVSLVNDYSKENQHPLLCTMEKV